MNSNHIYNVIRRIKVIKSLQQRRWSSTINGRLLERISAAPQLALSGPTFTLTFATQATASKTQLKKKMAKLTEQERTELLQPLFNVGWAMVKDRDAIYKEYLFKDFNQAFSFMAGTSLFAEKLNHHPEWFNVYNKVQVTMSTHDVGGLSAKDVKMANYMEEQAKRFI